MLKPGASHCHLKMCFITESQKEFLLLLQEQDSCVSLFMSLLQDRYPAIKWAGNSLFCTQNGATMSQVFVHSTGTERVTQNSIPSFLFSKLS